MEIADPCSLYRGRTHGESAQAIHRRMPRQINENVDAVVPDLFRQLLVAHKERLEPMIGMGLYLLCHMIGEGHLGITEHFETGLVVVTQDVANQKPDRMRCEITGDIADSYRPWR